MPAVSVLLFVANMLRTEADEPLAIEGYGSKEESDHLPGQKVEHWEVIPEWQAVRFTSRILHPQHHPNHKREGDGEKTEKDSVHESEDVIRIFIGNHLMVAIVCSDRRVLHSDVLQNVVEKTAGRQCKPATPGRVPRGEWDDRRSWMDGRMWVARATIRRDLQTNCCCWPCNTTEDQILYTSRQSRWRHAANCPIITVVWGSAGR